MSEKELKLQVELLQKQNEELKISNHKLREEIAELTEQAKEFKFGKDIAQAISLANRGRKLKMTVVYYNKHQQEHITIENVWKIERSINHLIYADGIRVHYIENEQKKGIRIPNDYVTSINV